MSETIRVFVNTRAVDLPAGAEVDEAVRAYDPLVAGQLQAGIAFVTDARGIEVDPGARLANGAILRVVMRARRGSSTGASDADA